MSDAHGGARCVAHGLARFSCNEKLPASPNKLLRGVPASSAGFAVRTPYVTQLRASGLRHATSLRATAPAEATILM